MALFHAVIDLDDSVSPFVTEVTQACMGSITYVVFFDVHFRL